MKWLDALGVSESYQVPDAMMKALMDGTKRHELFSLYLQGGAADIATLLLGMMLGIALFIAVR